MSELVNKFISDQIEFFNREPSYAEVVEVAVKEKDQEIEKLKAEINRLNLKYDFQHLVKENESLKARLLEYDGRTYSENEEIKKLKAENDSYKKHLELFEESIRHSFKIREDKLQAENAELKDRCDEAERDRQDLFHELNDSTHEITKLTRQRDTLKKCAEFYADDGKWTVVRDFIGDENFIGFELFEAEYAVAQKALQGVEESENEKS